MEKLERACSTAFQSLMQSDLKYKDKQAHQERCKVVYERTHFHVAILILNKTKQIQISSS